MHERRRIIFTGRVQGVGFRYTVLRLSAGRAVTGFVRNVPDGTVELVAEGLKNEIDGFVAAVAAYFEENIHHTDATTSPATGEFKGFEIRR